MKTKEYIFDNIPKSWDEIPLSKWLDLRNAYEDKTSDKDKNIHILSILIDRPYEEVMQYPISVIQKLTEAISFINEEIKFEYTNEISINDEIYRINIKDELKFGEFVDAETVLQAKEEEKEVKYAILLAILCRKEGEVYDEEFKRKKLNDRIELFSNQPITKVYPLMNFFLVCSIASQMNMKEYLDKEVELGNQLLDSIENSLNCGDGVLHSMNSVEMILQKYRKQLNSI